MRVMRLAALPARASRALAAAAIAVMLPACDVANERAPVAGDAAPMADPDLPGASPDTGLTRLLSRALAARPAGYRPRTRHLREDGGPKYTNRLILETSPYLLQHAHNPVNWYPWSAAAFERARAQNKPVLLSIGYSTCHWCHVMEHESFEDEQIARLLNERYVAIKVDREERPDIDALYMTAVQVIRGSGGWPMTLVLTPDRQAFFAGSYIPARDGDRGVRKGFLTILAELADSYASERDALVARAAGISGAVAQALEPKPAAGVPDASVMDRALAEMAEHFDERYGGFGRAPKFPRPAQIELLLRYYARTGDERALAMAVRTLEGMAAGGMRDHVGGGFHRYSVDAEWRVPHFEKMLYDNAQLAVAYLEAFQVTGRQDLADVTRATLDYVQREMTAASGGFHSATDADSAAPDGHVEEGRFFTWTKEEVEATLGEAAPLFLAWYDVGARDDVDGRSVVALARPFAEMAQAPGGLQLARNELYRARSLRPAPLLDDKILASWNGLMTSAFARAGLALDRPDYVSCAARAASFLLESMRDDAGRLSHVFAGGVAGRGAFLDDYAFAVQGLLDLFEATADPRWLREAVALQGVLDAHYADSAGGYFFTADDEDPLPARHKPAYDGAEPSGNSVAALNLLRLAELTQNDAFRSGAEKVLGAFGADLARNPGASPKMLAALDFLFDRAREVVLVAPSGIDPEYSGLRRLVGRTFLPNHAFVFLPSPASAELAELVPLVQDKKAIDGRATAYVCERGHCERPVQGDPALLASQLARRPARKP